MVIITLFPICYSSQLKHLDMNAIVLGRHARLPSFRKLKPLGVWELKNATNYIHYVILTMYICDFHLLFYSSIYSLYSSCFSQINLMKTGIGHFKYCIPYTFFTLFDQSLQKSFWLWFYERNFQRQFRAGEWQKTAKENAVVKNFDELGRVKGSGTGGGSGAW